MLQWPHRCNYQTSDAALQCCDDWVQKRGAHSALLYSHESTRHMSCLALVSRSSARPCTALHAMPCQHLLPTSRFLSSFAKVDRMRRLFRCIRAGLQFYSSVMLLVSSAVACSTMHFRNVRLCETR